MARLHNDKKNIRMGISNGVNKWLLLILFIFLAYLASYFASTSTKNEQDAIVPQDIKRIISLNAAATQILVELGLEDKIVGISNTFSNPAEVKEKPKLGRGFGNINVEAVLSLRPDIVFAYKSDAEILKEQGVNVFIVQTCSLNEVLDLITEIGRVLNKQAQACQIAQRMKKRIEEIQEKLKGIKSKPLVYFEAGPMGRTRGPGSLTHDLITLAGGINLARDEPAAFPLLNSERIIEMNPDIIILEEYCVSAQELKKRDGWQDINAVKNNRIFISPVIYTNYTPKCIEGLQQYARWFHPEAFEQ